MFNMFLSLNDRNSLLNYFTCYYLQ